MMNDASIIKSLKSNPIILNKKSITIGTTLVELSQSAISKYFQDIFILVKKNDIQNSINYYKKEIDDNIIEEMKNNLILWKVSVNILKNKKMFDRICIFTKEYCEMFNQFGFTFNDNNIVVPILNISFKNLIDYLNNSDGYTLDKLYNLILLSGYFGDDFNNIKFQYKLEKEINNLEESNYWELPYNCSANLTKFFKRRKIDISLRIKKEEDIINEDDLKNDEDDLKNNEDDLKNDEDDLKNDKDFENKNKEDYLHDIFKRNKYIDASNIIMNNGYKIYNISKSCNYSKDEIYELLKSLDNKNQYYLVSNLMISKKYCHLIINNEKVLDLMKDEFVLKAPLFRYLLGYAWLRFYFEESIKKRNMTIEDEFIFDINTASKLPIYPFNIKFPKMNPYMPIMVADNVLNAHQNIGSIKNYKLTDTSKKYCNQGICNLVEFRERLNLFVTNNIDNNLFNDIKWKKWKVVICGSVMTACIQYYHPLVNLFDKKDTPLNVKLIRFFNEYYATSDIDVMFSHNNTIEYMEAVEHFFNQIVVNTCVIYRYAEPRHVKLNRHFQLHFCINEEWIDKNIVSDSITHEFIINNIEDNQIISLFKPFIDDYYKKYLKIELNKVNESSQNKCYINYFNKLDDYNIKIYINEYNKEPVIKFNYKYRITCPHFNHPIEIFNISNCDQMGAISQFHLPCVRALYNGNNVYMTPSCITAHLTFMNIDYKYFACKTNPFDIINKYRMRGFGTWLNKNEISYFWKYSLEDTFWKNIYGGIHYSNASGCLPLSHKLFHPRLINADKYFDILPVCLEDGYEDKFIGVEVTTIDELNHEIKSKDKFESIGIDKFTTIDSNGNIIPLQKWIIDAYYKSNKWVNELPTK
jgi:hypothetical protein